MAPRKKGTIRDHFGAIREGSGIIRESLGIIRESLGVIRKAFGIIRGASGATRDRLGAVRGPSRTLREDARSPLAASGANRSEPGPAAVAPDLIRATSQELSNAMAPERRAEGARTRPEGPAEPSPG